MSVHSLPVPDTAPAAGRDYTGVNGFAGSGGLHCETSALRKALAHMGIHHSEEFLFGMAGGAGFIFWRQGDDSVPFVGGRNGKFPEFVVGLGEAIGQKVRVITTASEKRAYQNLMAELKSGRPVVCYGDILYLPYFHSTRHFGGHAFVVYGIDEEQDQVWISDRGRQSQVISRGDLAKARGSKTRVFPPRNAQLQIAFDPAARVREKAVRRAILASCHAMLNPPISNFGLRGLGKMRTYLEHAFTTLDAPQLCEVAVATYVNLALAGTGGCAFREMYHRFLMEVSAIETLRPAEEALPALERSIRAWTAFIEGLLPAVAGPVSQLREALDEKEQAFEKGGPEGFRDGKQRQAEIEALRAQAGEELARHRAQLIECTQAIPEIQAAEAECFQSLERRFQ